MQIIKWILGEERYVHAKNVLNLRPRKKWYRMVFKDLKNNSDVPLRRKLWAYKRGFLSGKINLFNLTRDNFGTFMSDYDYIKLYPINGRFSFWIDDKLTTKYILAEYSDFLPEYYFHLTDRSPAGVLKLMDCPEGCSSDINGVLKLLESKSALAVKPLSGTFGAGFFKFTFQLDKYRINGREADKESVYAFLCSMKDHIVTEYVQMHDGLKKIYANSLNTVRLIIVNEDGREPFVGVAGIKFGTERSGTVDNVSAGGIYCLIDVHSGYFCGGFGVTEDHKRVSYEVHPDTHEKLEGFIPNWNIIADGILKICRYVPQLEYMGFDIAVTGDGFKIIEINSYPGMNRTADPWSENLTNYFSRLLKRKGIKSVNGF